ncbi:hypothetical protein V2J09_008318 [Rumex salicifolius]
MVFSSDYFGPPPNWHQQANHQQQTGIFPPNDHQVLPSPPAQAGGSGVNGTGSIRSGSMLDRARMARVPLPEPGLKCPRCDSSNTKFCYFNNYNLTQPRHFCKACRRYWTRGGALRNVPVGGRLRKNKRSKVRAAKSSNPGQPSQIRNSTTNISPSVNTNGNGNGNGFTSQMLMPPTPHLPYLPGLHHLNGYPGGFGLNLGGSRPVEFESSGAGSSAGVSRVQQLTNFLSGSGSTGNGLYPFHENDNSTEMGHASGFGSQIARVKAEDNNNNCNLSKNINMMDIQGNDVDEDDQYSNWGSGNPWTDISGFNPMGTSGYGDRTRDQ